MATDRPKGAYLQLVHGVSRSYEDWKMRLGQATTDDFISAGYLETSPLTIADGYEGLFDLGHGPEAGQLFIKEGILFCLPDAGGSAVQIHTSSSVLTAHPMRLFKKIAEANKFTLLDPAPGQSTMVAVAERSLSGKFFKILIVLDAKWPDMFGTKEWVTNLAIGMESLILLNDCQLKIFPWQISHKIAFKVAGIPSSETKWQVPKSWYGHPQFGIDQQGILEVYGDKKLIIDGVKKVVFVFGRRLEITEDSRTFHFFRGISLMGTSALGTDAFAKDYFGYHADDADDVVRRVKTQAKEAIKKAFPESGLQDQVIDLCMPTDRPTKTILHNFLPNDVEFLGPA
jgi:hypothetical protein